MAGCETIWVVGNMETVPLVRKRIGDFIYDPTTIGSNPFSKNPDKHRRLVSIYYVPITEFEGHRSNCLPWSIIKGAEFANDISGAISKWTRPKMFWVSFPYGITEPKHLREFRKSISKEQNTFLRYDEETVLDGKHLPFTFGQEDLARFLEHFREYENQMSINSQDEDEYFTEKATLGIIVKESEMNIDNVIDLSWYHQIDSWDNYRSFLSDSETREVKSPGKIFIHYKEWNPISEEL